MKFYKYCASGNDFVITNADRKEDRSALAKELCNRYEGIGGDGFIVILPHEKYDFEWEFIITMAQGLLCVAMAQGLRHILHIILTK